MFPQASYTNWAAGMSDNLNVGKLGQDCVEIGFQSNDQWNDDRCDALQKFICERSAGTQDPGKILLGM